MDSRECFMANEQIILVTYYANLYNLKDSVSDGTWRHGDVFSSVILGQSNAKGDKIEQFFTFGSLMMFYNGNGTEIMCSSILTCFIFQNNFMTSRVHNK